MAIKQYRSEYPGEFVITKMVIRNGKKEQEREWIDNPVDVTSSNHRACCIASGPSSTKIPMKRIEQHRGDLLGRNRMQLYASEDVWEEMTPDFLVVLNQERLDQILENGYQTEHVVYTSVRLCINNPGEFFIIPHGVMYQPAALAVWIACFDGHKDIYLYGYDETLKDGVVQTKVINTVQDIMKTYQDVNFHHVTDTGTPDAWRRCINCRTISSRDFVTECDI